MYGSGKEPSESNENPSTHTLHLLLKIDIKWSDHSTTLPKCFDSFFSLLPTP